MEMLFIFKENLYHAIRERIYGRIRVRLNVETDSIHVDILSNDFEFTYDMKNCTDKLLDGLSSQQVADEIEAIFKKALWGKYTAMMARHFVQKNKELSPV